MKLEINRLYIWDHQLYSVAIGDNEEISYDNIDSTFLQMIVSDFTNIMEIDSSSKYYRKTYDDLLSVRRELMNIIKILNIDVNLICLDKSCDNLNLEESVHVKDVGILVRKNFIDVNITFSIDNTLLYEHLAMYEEEGKMNEG